MTTQQKHTLASVRKLARQRWGAKVDVEHRPEAPGPLAKAQMRERRDALKAEQAAVKAERETLANAPRDLLLAAQLVVEEWRDGTGMPALRSAVEAAQRADNLKRRAHEIHQEIQQLAGQILWDRYRVAENKGWCNHIHAAADTLAELAAKIEAK